MTFFLQIAGITIQINSIYERVRKKSADYIVEQREPDIVVDVKESELAAEKSLYDSNTEMETVEFMLVHRKIAEEILSYDTVLMHGSVVGVDQSAYMFTAKSGVGKTTRTNTWMRCIKDSYIINGDKPFLKFEDEQVFACGSPWCGKENKNSNVMIPLKAIFFLERSQENKVTEINFQEAFPLLIKQTYTSKQTAKVIKTIRLLKALDGKVKFYRFQSNLKDEAVIEAYKLATESVN